MGWITVRGVLAEANAYSVIFLLILGAARLMHVSWRMSLAIALALLIPYAALVGFRVSVIRATLLIAATVAGRLMGRTVDALSGLAVEVDETPITIERLLAKLVAAREDAA